jgi:bacterioferritin-associated ferredoxin
LTDFNINFVDRQTLKILEDSVIDLQVILPTLLNNITGIRDQCGKCSKRWKMNEDDANSVESVMDELDEYVTLAKCHVERAKILRERATAIAQLASDLTSVPFHF